jgi:hypothetical protein
VHICNTTNMSFSFLWKHQTNAVSHTPLGRFRLYGFFCIWSLANSVNGPN